MVRWPTPPAAAGREDAARLLQTLGERAALDGAKYEPAASETAPRRRLEMAEEDASPRRPEDPGPGPGPVDPPPNLWAGGCGMRQTGDP